MAIAYLNENATSLAAANWSDATGFAAAATLFITDGSVPIVNDVDHGSSNIEYLVITEGRTGDIAAAGTPVECQVDNSADARIEYRASGGRFYFAHADSTSQCEIFVVNSTGGSVYLEGGTIDDLQVARVAYLHVNASTVLSDTAGEKVYLGSGRGVIENNATGITECNIFGGNWTIKRDGTYNIYGPATVVFDIPDASPTTTINQYAPGSVVQIKRGDVGTVVHHAGLMATKGERPISIGSSSYTRGPANLAKTAFNDIDTIATPTVWGGQTEQIGESPL